MLVNYGGRRYRLLEEDGAVAVYQEQSRLGKRRWVRLHPRLDYTGPAQTVPRKPSAAVATLLRFHARRTAQVQPIAAGVSAEQPF